MTDKVNDMEHANATNPCQGICVQDDNDFCIGCMRTTEERSCWYEYTDVERDKVLEKIAIRVQGVFDEN